MRLPAIIILTVSLFLGKTNHVHGQKNRLFIDSVKHYISITDSLINSFYNHPGTRLIHRSAHFNCINQAYGAFLDFHEDTTGTISKLEYRSICDTPMVEITYYIINDKIVFASKEYPQGQRKKMTKFYLNDKLLMLNGYWVKRAKQAFDNDLKEGYAKLRSLHTK
jgi:hypothetical protein